MKYTNILLAAAVLISTHVQAQEKPDVSASMESCVREGAVSRLTVKNGKLECSQTGNILWVEGVEIERTGQAHGVVRENVTLDEVNQIFGDVKVSQLVTVDHRKVRANGDLDIEDDAKVSGTDISIDTFIISQIEAKILGGKKYSDPDAGLTREPKKGESEDTIYYVGASNYGFYPLRLSANLDMTQVILPGTTVCSKPQKMGDVNIPGMSRSRLYIEHSFPSQYCYGDSLGIDLPASFKDGSSDQLVIRLILPYSQKGLDGQEDDLVGFWSFITKKQYDNADYILLTSGMSTNPETGATSPRVVIGLTKNPAKLDQ